MYARLRTDTALRARACTRAREIIEEFSLGSIASPVCPTVLRTRRYHTDHADVGAGLVGAAIGQRWRHCRSRGSAQLENERAGSNRSPTPSAPNRTSDGPE